MLLTGVRFGELRALRWRDVRLADPSGPWLHVGSSISHGRETPPKSQRGVRDLDVGPALAEELYRHRERTPFDGDDEFVLANPRRGTPLDPHRYARCFRLAQRRAGIEGGVRPAHDLRATCLTRLSEGLLPTAALSAVAGHADWSTTMGYVNHRGLRRNGYAEALERRLLGDPGTTRGYIPAAAETEPEAA
jgi:integrase